MRSREKRWRNRRRHLLNQGWSDNFEQHGLQEVARAETTHVAPRRFKCMMKRSLASSSMVLDFPMPGNWTMAANERTLQGLKNCSGSRCAPIHQSRRRPGMCIPRISRWLEGESGVIIWLYLLLGLHDEVHNLSSC